MLKTQRLADFLSLKAIQSAWNELAAGIPFRRYEWLGMWAETYLDERQLYVLTATEEDRLVGLLPLYRSESVSQGGVLRWLGSGEVCTDYLGVMAAHGYDSRVIELFADWLAEASRSREHGWNVMQLDSVDDQEQTIIELQEKLVELDCTLHRSPGLNCWRIDLPDDWDEYLARMSKSHRKQLRRVERRILDNAETRILSVVDERSFAEGMEILVDLHQKRRHSLGEPGCFSSDRFTDFLHTSALQLLSSGLLRLTWAESAGVPIACEFQLAGPSMTYAYQAGINPDQMGLEPGRLIMIATIQNAIAAGQTAFDFLRGDEPYKAHWRATPRPTLNIRVVAPKAASQLRHGIWLACSSLKELVQSKTLPPERP